MGESAPQWHQADGKTRMKRRRELVMGLGAASALAAWPGRACAAEAPPFRLAYFETYSPLSFVEGGALKGILVDVLDEVIGRRLGQACRHEGLPWPRAQSLVERGERDAICTIATSQRLAYAVAAEVPVVSAPICVFLRADHPRLAAYAQARDLAELRALQPTVLSYSANGWAKDRLAEFNVEWGGDFNSALKMLLARRGDIMVENSLVMQHSLKRLSGGGLLRRLPNALDQAHFQLLVGRQSPHIGLLPEFSKAMAQFKATPAYGEIFKRYGVQAF
jgi:polar amino acid transport system substrate-binding protein